LLIFGFFGVSAATTLALAGTELSQFLNLQTAGEISFVPTWVRIASGAACLGGIADAVAAVGGLALMADLPRARVITATGLGIAAASVILTFVTAPYGYSLLSVGQLILDVAIVVFVVRWQPRRASGMRSVPPENAGPDGAGAPIT
jgi:hypothetical protein